MNTSDYPIPQLTEITKEEIWQIERLSKCQFRIFVNLGAGKRTSEIADEPGYRCSIKTIESHIAHIREQTGLASVTAIAHLATKFLFYYHKNKFKTTDLSRRDRLPHRVFEQTGI